jgi:hypothetical protein
MVLLRAKWFAENTEKGKFWQWLIFGEADGGQIEERQGTGIRGQGQGK